MYLLHLVNSLLLNHCAIIINWHVLPVSVVGVTLVLEELILS